MKPNEPTDTISKRMYASVGNLAVVGDYMTNTPQPDFAESQPLTEEQAGKIAQGIFESTAPSMISSLIKKISQENNGATYTSGDNTIAIDAAHGAITITSPQGVAKIDGATGSISVQSGNTTMLLDAKNNQVVMSYGAKALTIDPTIHSFYDVQVTYNGVYSMMNVLGTLPAPITY